MSATITQTEAIRILTEQEMLQRLLQAGFWRETCATCEGKRFFRTGQKDLLTGENTGCSYLCDTCGGFGVIWHKPEVK